MNIEKQFSCKSFVVTSYETFSLPKIFLSLSIIIDFEVSVLWLVIVVRDFTLTSIIIRETTLAQHYNKRVNSSFALWYERSLWLSMIMME